MNPRTRHVSRGFAAILLLPCVLAACDDSQKRFVELSNQGVQSVQSEDYGRAASAFREALKLQPEDAEIRYFMGTIALREDHAGEAVDHLQIAVKSDPKWPDAQLNLARALFAAKRSRDAVTALNALFALDPGHPNGHLLAARIAQEAGDRGKVDEQLRAAITGDATFAPAYLMLSHLYTEVGAYEAARQVAEEGLKFAADSVELKEALGLAWLDLGRPDRARPVLEQASQMPRARYGVYMNLAAAALQVGDKPSAIQALRTYLLQASGQKADEKQLMVAARMLKHLKDQAGE